MKKVKSDTPCRVTQENQHLMDKPERKVKSVSGILPVTRFWRGRDGKIHFIVRRDR